MRRTSGITHITLFTRPEPCGGDCLFCPTVPGQPKSYLPHADIARLGIGYPSREQMRHWLAAARARGAGAKIEVIVLGGSFAAHDPSYQEEFLRGIYEAQDDGGIHPDTAGLIAAHAAGRGPRVIGITVEMRPDQVRTADLARLFSLGVTKIELGAQSLDDRVLALNDRRQTEEQLAAATASIKSSGLKVGYHLLFGLPGADRASDLESARRVFADERHQPDHLKIYFCEMFRREFMKPRLVTLFDRGEWRPLDAVSRRERLLELLPLVPPWMRISRIGRKSTDEENEGGARTHFDRGLIEREAGCRCVRCREPRPEDATERNRCVVRKMKLSARELFLEAQPAKHEACLGLLRLHLSSDRAIVRELHVYGLETPPGSSGPHQHRGVGQTLMAAAEAEARAAGFDRLAVASGVGVRRYYEKLGYRLEPGGLMVKDVRGRGVRSEAQGQWVIHSR